MKNPLTLRLFVSILFIQGLLLLPWSAASAQKAFIPEPESKEITLSFPEPLKAEKSIGSSRILPDGATINGLTIGSGGDPLLSNTVFGLNAFATGSTGTSNIALGRETLFSNTTGIQNTAIGTISMRANTTGRDNVAVGVGALRANTSGSRNSALGFLALYLNTTGQNNTAIGNLALYSNTTGYNNTAIGSRALYNNTVGAINVAVGDEAMFYNTTGLRNTSIGSRSLFRNTEGWDNFAGGSGALFSNTTGELNVAVGSTALMGNITGNYNVAIGARALRSTKDISFLVAVGDSALFYNGTDATQPLDGTRNTAVGSKALFANTTGAYNTSLGYRALMNNITGRFNTAGGYHSLTSNSEGYWNTAFGITTLSNNNGNDNTAFGANALELNENGNNNVAIGSLALYGNQSGSGNTAIGVNAGANFPSIYANLNNSTFVGHVAYALNDNITNATGIGHGARPTSSNQVVIGNSSVTQIGGAVDWSVISDGNYKMNVEDGVAGLDFILRLRPVTYNLDAAKLASDLRENLSDEKSGAGYEGNSDPDSDGLRERISRSAEAEEINKEMQAEKSRITYTGFVAQEVEEAAIQAGYDFSGVTAPKSENDYYTIRYGSFTVPLVKAVQELSSKVDVLGPEAARELEELVAGQQESIERLSAANEHLLAVQDELREENLRVQIQLEDMAVLINSIVDGLKDCCSLNDMGYNVPGGVDNTGGLGLLGTGQPSAGLTGPGLNAGGLARLEQNAPNPFSEHTWIRYHLPQGTTNARIVLTDLGGNRVMSYDLPGDGVGQLMISGGALRSGTYIYTLVVNGEVADSKRLVLL